MPGVARGPGQLSRLEKSYISIAAVTPATLLGSVKTPCIRCVPRLTARAAQSLKPQLSSLPSGHAATTYHPYACLEIWKLYSLNSRPASGIENTLSGTEGAESAF